MLIQGRYPTVPEYFREFINHDVDLINHPKQCCPFHQEKTPSFSYNLETGRWTCFGQCHASGDVIEMHRRLRHYATTEQAEKSLDSLCGISAMQKFDNLRTQVLLVDPEKRELNEFYQCAIKLANTPDRWIELDRVLSVYPIDVVKLQGLVYSWSNY